MNFRDSRERRHPAAARRRRVQAGATVTLTDTRTSEIVTVIADAAGGFTATLAGQDRGLPQRRSDARCP